MKKTHQNLEIGMSLGLCIGTALGSAAGELLFHNLTLSMCFGMCIGLSAGLLLGALKDAAVNKQLEEFGYTITEIEPVQDLKDFQVILTDKNGRERILYVSAGEMETELFKVGNAVFLDEDGNIEQAYENETL